MPWYKICYLIEWISLFFYSSFTTGNSFPYFIDRNANRSELNPVFESFRRIDQLNLYNSEFDIVMNCLSDVRDLELHVNKIVLKSYDSEQLEQMLNPELFPKGVDIIDLNISHSWAITDKLLYNINEIKPSKLYLECHRNSEFNFDFYRILTKTNSWVNLEISKGFLKTSCKLGFTNVTILTKSK